MNTHLSSTNHLNAEPPPLSPELLELKSHWEESLPIFFEKTVYDVCVPRNDIASISQDASLEEALRLVNRSYFTTYPIHTLDNQDEIVGILHLPDLLRHIEQTPSHKVGSIMRPVRFVAYNEPIAQVFLHFQREKISFAVVINQYGEMDGLLTTEDILRELVGEFSYYPVNVIPEPKNYKGKLVVDGRFELAQLRDNYGIELTNEEVETIGGYIYLKLGRVPEVGEKVKIDDLQFTILQKDTKIITRLSLEKVSQKKPEPPTAQQALATAILQD